MKQALIIGSQGGLGSALLEELKNQSFSVTTLNQKQCNYQEQDLEAYAKRFKEQGGFDLIICCVGTLHGEGLAPEKRLSQIKRSSLSAYFEINTIIPALCLRFFAPLLNKDSGVYVSLSAMVGSIGENQLGGWYGYRSSKAALNMMVKTASIELKRSHKGAALVVMHPGTTRSPLSKPFANRVKQEKYYTPEQSAKRILQVASGLDASNSGQFLNWDGREIAW